MESALTVADLNITVNHEPRIAHRRLAASLGFVQRHKMAHLIERHLDALQRFGEVPSTMDETGPKGGRPGKTYWLNKKQALYLCTKSETANATEVTIGMVEVFDAYQQGKLGEKPVKVRAHRRALPSPAAAPASTPDAYGAPFGVEIAREMYRAIMSANVRVERGQAPDFGSALEAVFSDIVTQLYGGDPVMGKILLGAPMHRARAKWAVPLSS